MSGLGILLSALYAFTATATGVEKGTPLEFFIIDARSDRAYESMFVLDGAADAFCREAESKGLPRGRPTDAAKCRLWPAGCRVKLDPPVSRFVDTVLPDSIEDVPAVYTGGSRTEKGTCRCADEMPAAVYALYSLAQAPIVPDGIHEQSLVYGSHTARVKLKKGERVRFELSWDEHSAPRQLALTARSGHGHDLIERLKSESRSADLDVQIGFDGGLSLAEAKSIAEALSSVDSRQVRINGFDNLFYQAFLPNPVWRDRHQRLQQPFELTLDASGRPHELRQIQETWTASDRLPILTEHMIAAADVVRTPEIDTCFIYADATTRVASIVQAKNALSNTTIRNWYVFSSHSN